MPGGADAAIHRATYLHRIHSTLTEHEDEVLEAVAGTTGQQRTRSVAGIFDGFVRAPTVRTRDKRRLRPMWTCFNVMFIGIARKWDEIGERLHLPSCRDGQRHAVQARWHVHAKRYGAASLAIGYVPKLKQVMVEQLRQLDDWDGVEKTREPCPEPISVEL